MLSPPLAFYIVLMLHTCTPPNQLDRWHHPVRLAPCRALVRIPTMLFPWTVSIKCTWRPRMVDWTAWKPTVVATILFMQLNVCLCSSFDARRSVQAFLFNFLIKNVFRVAAPLKGFGCFLWFVVCFWLNWCSGCPGHLSPFACGSLSCCFSNI